MECKSEERKTGYLDSWLSSVMVKCPDTLSCARVFDLAQGASLQACTYEPRVRRDFGCEL